MSWLHKLFDPTNMSPLKILLLSYIEKYDGGKILHLKKDLEGISDNLTPSWGDVFLILSEDEEENDIINILSQPIWIN